MTDIGKVISSANVSVPGQKWDRMAIKGALELTFARRCCPQTCLLTLVCHY